MFNNRSELFSQRSISQFSGPFFHYLLRSPCINHVSLVRFVFFFFFVCFFFGPILETPINGYTPYSCRIFIIPIKYLYP